MITLAVFGGFALVSSSITLWGQALGKHAPEKKGRR